MADPSPPRREPTAHERTQHRQSQLKRYFQRWLTRRSMDEIFPDIYLGGSYAAESIPSLTAAKITFVLSIMSKNLPPSTREAYMNHRIQHVFIKKYDESGEDLLAILPEACRVIEESRARGAGVLVHCAMGVSRSASVVVAYVMQRWGISPTEALTFVRGKRYVVSPNRGFLEQLEVWRECGYDVFSKIRVDGQRVPKEAYRRWLKRVEEMRAEEEREAAAQNGDGDADEDSGAQAS
ncbi:hypothetical protein N7G274_001283 [Stereocaulon virgatum]|uniref:protein-tyrosine-phosphatase n=1 Tax=Stereocaulon virgatum TaxID=373712 RepID=A0ABR4AND3_9LECA